MLRIALSACVALLSCGGAGGQEARDAAVVAGTALDGRVADESRDDGDCWPGERRCGGGCRLCPSAGVATLGCEADRCVASSCVLRHALRAGVCRPWTIEPIPLVGRRGDLALARDGTLHIALADGASLSYLTRPAQGPATIVRVPLGGREVSAVALELDALGRPTLLALDTDGAALVPIAQEVTGWRQGAPLEVGPDARHPVIALARGMVISTCHSAQPLSDLLLDRLGEAGWVSQRVSGEGAGGHSCDLAVGAEGTSHLVYQDVALGAVTYARRATGEWQRTEIDSGGGVGACVALALDAAGEGHLAYGGDGNVTYAHQLGAVWEVSFVDTESGPGGCLDVELVLDRSGRPWLSYSDWDEGSYDLKLARWTGTRWSVDRVDDQHEGVSALALDAHDRVYLLYDRAGSPTLARLD